MERSSGILSLTRLRIHSSASRQSFWDIIKGGWSDPRGRKSALFYLFNLGAFTGLTWALSVIFVIDYGENYNQYTLYRRDVILSADVPVLDDTCATSITSPNCAYDLAVPTLSSQLITHTPYTISSIEFLPPFGTQGLPYDVLNKFSQDVGTSAFGNKLYRQYCLPVLNAKTVSCEQDVDNRRVEYVNAGTAGGFSVYTVTINPNTAYADTHVRVSFQNGTMTVAQSQNPSEPQVTVITVTDIYADILSQLMYGENSATQIFTAVCTISTESSWQWVQLSYDNGVYRAPRFSEVKDCEGGDFTGFTDHFYAIQGATRVVNAIDGYSKYINVDPISPIGNTTSQQLQDYASANNMTLLESILSQLYEIVQTSYSATNPDLASATTVTEVHFRTAYVISVQWSVASVLALVMSAIIVCATLLQAIQYRRATQRMHQQPGPRWKLLDVTDLIGYSTNPAMGGLNGLLATEVQRENANKGRPSIML